MLQYLPTKLAEWIDENMQEELGFSDREESRRTQQVEFVLAERCLTQARGARQKWLLAAHFRVH